jgi:hypothetical protein
MKAYLFSEILSMSPEQRQALRQEPNEERLSVDVDKVAKEFVRVGGDYGDAVSAVFKAHPEAFESYRAGAYRRVNS